MEKRMKYVIGAVMSIGVLLAVAGCVDFQASEKPYNITIKMTEEGIAKMTIEGPPRTMELSICESEEGKFEDGVFFSRIGEHDFENGKVTILIVPGIMTPWENGYTLWVHLRDFSTGYEVQMEKVTIK